MKKLLAAILACSMIASVGVSTLVSAATAQEADSKFEASAVLANGDGDLTHSNEVLPNETYYIGIANLFDNITAFQTATDAAGTTLDRASLADTDEFKVSLKKGKDNSKIIKKLSVEVVNKGNSLTGRHSAIKIETAETFNGDEYKISPEFTFTGQDASKKGGQNWKGVKLYAKTTLYVKNETLDGDQEREVGDAGVVIKPAKGEDNEIIWTQDGNTVARVTFYADSDVIKMFPKLSTRWENADYFEYFMNQDAFIYDFVGAAAGATTVSSTSRALLEIFNPYIDNDGNSTIDLESIYVYEVKDGELNDVTDNWTKGTNDDGDEVITSKTRVLGTYILAEEEIDVGGGADVDEPTGPIDPGTSKPNPPTGR